MRNKLDNNKGYKFENLNINLDIDVDQDIEDDIKEFYIDKDIINKIESPFNLHKEIKKPVKEIKREKKKWIRYQVLDIIIVLLCVLPIIGIIQPKVFIKIPQVYPILKSINGVFQKDRIMSMFGIKEKGEIIEGDIESSKDTVYIKAEDVKMPTTNIEAIKLIHSLANTIVHAKYKWQCSEITPDTIDLAIKGVENITDNDDKMHLRNGLRKWSKGNFSNGVEVHNYVWEMLDGTVGKAHTLDEKEIEKIKNKYFNN